jgi:SnoaL-like domain
MDPIVQRLLDEHDIRRLVIGFSLGMDSRDFDLYRASWAEEVELDLPPLAGDVVPMSGRRSADEYGHGVISLLSQFKVTQHVSTNHLVSINGDTATCACYTFAQHYMPVDFGEPWFTAGARYDLGAQRFDEIGWRFVTFKLTPLWFTGNAGLWQEATRRLVAAASEAAD